jgi:hypothetical protein
MTPESGAQFGGRPIRQQRRHVACRHAAADASCRPDRRAYQAALCSKLCSGRDGKRRIGTGQDRIAIGGFRPEIVRSGVICEALMGPWTI